MNTLHAALTGIDGHTVLAAWIAAAAIWLAIRTGRARPVICESCGHRAATDTVQTRGILFAVCADCAPTTTESRR